jgi:hypothetical protein
MYAYIHIVQTHTHTQTHIHSHTQTPVHGSGEGGRLQDRAAGQLAVALDHVSEDASVFGDKRQIKRCFSVQGSLSLHGATCICARRERGGGKEKGGEGGWGGGERERAFYM